MPIDDPIASRPPRRREGAAGRARLGEHFTIGPRVAHAAVCHSYARRPGDPLYRPLQVYALDPSASVIDGATAVVDVPYEPLELRPSGFRGAILEIIDEAATEREAAARERVDLDDRFLLMQRGRAPAPEDVRFRQQMTYATCATTYAAFRRALGRDIAWSFRRSSGSGTDPRLRIRPNVDGLPNAFYDRRRGEVCFGSFTAAGTVAGRNVPRGRIALCLSHDVVVHEMSHALLDGLRSHFLHPSNLDVLAFHEAFADLVAIFQRFTYRDVVQAAIQTSRGEISGADLLTNIAVQFAQAMDATGALRSAVGGTNRRYEDAVEPHHRGELLVAAVFEAFTTVYQRKTLPLLRLATSGTGVLPAGAIPDLLAVELTNQACDLAAQFLTICIRAIDYCPPVDITFGEYLRAVITADADLVPHDLHGYREAWVDAFAKRRMYPTDAPSLSESALLWCAPELCIPAEPALSFTQLQFDGDPGRAASVAEMTRQAVAFGRLAADPKYCGEFGLAAADDPALGGDTVGLPVVESVRSSRRSGPDGEVVFDLIAEITQRRVVRAEKDRPGFDFFGGATAIFDPHGRVRFVIRKSVLDSERLRRQREFVNGDGRHFFGRGPANSLLPEPKLLLRLHEVTRPEFRTVATTRPAERSQVLRESSARRGVHSLATERYLLRAPGAGKPASVRLLKACLNRCVAPSPNLADTPSFDETTERVVSRLQRTAGVAVDGIVGPTTWSVIGRALQHEVAQLPLTSDIPMWIQRLLANDPLVQRRLQGIDVASFLDLYQFGFAPLSLPQHEGLSFLLQAMADDEQLTDIRWMAYMLATVKHECADTWRPIEEIGKGRGRRYGIAETVSDTDGTQHQNTYYGRGYVQLTWKYNYEAVGRAIGMGNALLIRPELALAPATAYRIMSHGMRHGIFTGKTLAKYLDANHTDYYNARRIINGIDQATAIAGYATRLEMMLLANVP